MLFTISSGAVCFRTIPEQPSFIAWTNSFLSSEAVRTITLDFAVDLLKRLQCCQAVHIRHPEVEDQDIGIRFLDNLYDFPAIRCLADDFDVFFKSQQLSETVADDRMIVSQTTRMVGA